MTFQSGISGNPQGRPKGTGSRQQVFKALIEPHREALFQKAVDLASEGNEAMLRLLLVGKQTLQAVASGNLTPEEAVRIFGFLGIYSKNLMLVSIEQRLALLEKAAVA